MRVTTAFNRLLAVPGASVIDVEFTDAGVVAVLRKRSQRLRCECGWSTRAIYDRSVRRWRHLDLATRKVWLQAEIRRLHCRPCGRVRTEQIPWARPGARHTTAFEDLAVFLATQMSRDAVRRLLRCSWEAVTAIVARVVAEQLDDARFDGLVRIGVDEIGYRRGRRFLTIVACHDTGRVVWVAEGKDTAALQQFFDALGPERAARIESISMDMGKAYRKAAAEAIPQAAVCLDAFHLVKWTNEALERVLREHSTGKQAQQFRRERYLLRAGQETVPAEHRRQLARLRREHAAIGRAHDLKEALRDLFRTVENGKAAGYLRRWIARAKRCNIGPFQTLARRVEAHFDGIVQTVEQRISNSRLEGINAKIRLINARAFGHHSSESLAAMIYLNLGGISVRLPTET